MKTAVEIYKLLPKTNCGKCATSSCFGFAAKLATRQAKEDECPNMTASAREALRSPEQGQVDSPGTVFEQTLLALKPKVAALDFARVAGSSGATLLEAGCLEITFLNDRYTVTRDCILDSAGRAPKPFIAILIYNHLCMPDSPPPSGEWITFGSVPASHAKDKAWTGHVEEEIARHFSGNTEGLRKACERLGGTQATMSGSHDAAFEFRFFPRYPALLLFYDVVPDEDFPAQVKLLLDRNVDKYLDIESIVVLGEEFAGRLTS
ncbi:MAG TPA: DUF3786 domain-containing protein [Nitrospirota bacterium]|nr:DUF3786 domain-containing protein [Nitrospirota bacterium]